MHLDPKTQRKSITAALVASLLLVLFAYNNCAKPLNGVYETSHNSDIVLERFEQSPNQDIPIIMKIKSSDDLTGVANKATQNKEKVITLLKEKLSVNSKASLSVKEFQDQTLLAASLSKEKFEALKESGYIEDFYLDELVHLNLSASRDLIGANKIDANSTAGEGLGVAVIDTGVQINHPALASRVVDGACFSEDCPDGTNAQLGVEAGAACTEGAGCYHGSHVAGIIAANSASLKGIAPRAKIISVQVFDARAEGARESDIVRALEFVLSKVSTHNIVAVNLSLGGGRYSSLAACRSGKAFYLNAIQSLRNRGVAVVIASGNESYDNEISSPACLPGVIRVGSTSKADAISSYSNQSNWLSFLAPGQSIVSLNSSSSTRTASGTSMAAPHVAGGIALLKSLNPSRSVDEIVAALRRSAHRIYDNRSNASHLRISLDRADYALKANQLQYFVDSHESSSSGLNLEMQSFRMISGEESAHGTEYLEASSVSSVAKIEFASPIVGEFEWVLYHPNMPAGHVLKINLTNAEGTSEYQVSSAENGKTSLGVFFHNAVSKLEVSSSTQAWTFDKIEITSPNPEGDVLEKTNFVNGKGMPVLDASYGVLGGTGKIESLAVGSIAAIYRWYKAGQFYRETSAPLLEFENLRAEDAGIYTLRVVGFDGAEIQNSEPISFQVINPSRASLVQFKTRASIGAVVKIFYQNELSYSGDLLYSNQVHNVIIAEPNINSSQLRIEVE